jgi:dTDP-4-dehydrorhamnose reductase
MRVLIIGANGMLGTDLLGEWKDDELIPATQADADIRNADDANRLIARTQPDWVILTAAFTDVDGAERDPATAFAVNETGAKNVAAATQKRGAKLMYISTDYVFDGTGKRPYEPDDPINPINIYGESKARGEKAVRENSRDWCIVRTSWLFGTSGPNFPEKILRAAQTRPELSVVSDQLGSPTFTRDLARTIRDLVHADARGIVAVTNSGTCTWFDFAAEILRQVGKAGIPIKPISTVQSERAAKRPAYSVLSHAALNSYGIHTRDWRDALSEFLAEMRQKGKLA